MPTPARKLATVSRGRVEHDGVDLIAELEALPAHPTAALRVLWMADDAKSSAGELAGVVNSDPALTTRVMKVANSAYYGLSGRVGSAAFAVTILGFDTVRAIAAATASGMTGDHGTLPDGFWDHAAACAVGCSAIASRAGVRAPEGFSLGLLHDLGSALLHRGFGPLGDDAPSEWDGPARLEFEQTVYGIDHASAARRVLESWWFPAPFTEALGAHHDDPATIREPLSRVLVAGEALAGCALGLVEPLAVRAHLGLVGLEPGGIDLLVEKVTVDAEGLSQSLNGL